MNIRFHCEECLFYGLAEICNVCYDNKPTGYVKASDYPTQRKEVLDKLKIRGEQEGED